MTSETTGGQYCVSGIVLQLLVGLDRTTSLAVKALKEGPAEILTAQITLEPAAGGDHDIDGPGIRLVEQVKQRSTGKPWTAGDIAEEVLPDLLKAVRDDEPASTRFRLVTDGTINAPHLLAFAERLHGLPVPEDPVAAFDDTNRRAYRYDAWRSERGYFNALMARAGAKDARAFWTLLANLELEGGVSETQLIERIEAVLADIVDASEDVPGKRHELCNRMAMLAKKGGATTAAALLEQAGLPVDRLLHRARLPALLARRLRDDLAALGYAAEHDVRDPVRHPGREPLLISGESGFGKSWRLASLLEACRADGHLALLVTHARTLDDVRQAIVEHVWLTAFDRPVDLPALQHRIGKQFADASGTWLTVGVDDVQERELLNQLLGARWSDYGIKIVVTVPERLAVDAARMAQPPASLPVGPMLVSQVRRFLEGHGLHLRGLPVDVVELLRRPIFADLYRRIGGGDWRPHNEYELIDRFWQHATHDSRGMADHQDDVVALDAAGRSLLEPTGHYPWQVEDLVPLNLDQAARARLIATGLIRATADGVVLTHDRILNWLVARVLAIDIARERRSPVQVAQLLLRLDEGQFAPGIGLRLGYVLLDLIWLLADRAPAARIVELLQAYLCAPESRMVSHGFIEGALAEIGSRILPALELMARIPDTDHRMHDVQAARAIGVVAARYPTEAAVVVARLLAPGQDAQAERMGLIAAARTAVPAGIDQLWSVHLARRSAQAALPADGDIRVRHDHFDQSRTSFRALKRTVAVRPDWIEQALAATSDALSAELLLEQLIEVDHGVGADIWTRTKSAFLARVPAGRATIIRAIARFSDRSEADRLEQASAEADFQEPTQRFDALLRVAPERAIRQLQAMPEDTLRHSWFSIRRLVRDGGPDAQTAFRLRHDTGWEGMRDLALAYRNDPDLIDVESFDAIIAAFEARLAELSGTPWSPRGESHFLRFLGRTRRPDLLARLRSLGGSRFEHLLTELATNRRSRSSLCADIDSADLERLLLAIGGEGYGLMVADAIARETVYAREDGYEAALRLPPGSPHAAGLVNALNAPGRFDRENYDLMLALAVQRQDATLYALIAESGAAYTDGLDIRRSLGPMDPQVAAQIRANIESPVGSVRIGATCALAFAPPEDVADLLADTLGRCPDDDESALTVVRIANHLEVYVPRMLPQLRRMWALQTENIRNAILPYLAHHGDAEARELVSTSFEAEAEPVIDTPALRAAFSLSAHEPGEGPGTRRMFAFIERHHRVYPIGLLATRLHVQNAMSDEALIELAYGAQNISAESSALLVDRIASFDTAEALGIAEKHFAENPCASNARQILILGGADGLEHLLRVYAEDSRIRMRAVIARAIRRHADRALVLTRLSLFARGNSPDLRVIAAELLGWLRHPDTDALLDLLARDVVPEVADAAMDAQGLLEAEGYGRTLIAAFAGASHLERWSLLYALVDLVDPYLLEEDTDGLAIGPVLDACDEALAIGAECAIRDRKKALEKEADQQERRRDD